MAPIVQIDAATAERLGRERLDELDRQGIWHELDVAQANVVLACGLQEAEHRAQWRHSADEEDIWLLEFHVQDRLLALAAINASTGEVEAITFGQWD